MAFLCVMLNALILFPILINMLRKLYEEPGKGSQVEEEEKEVVVANEEPSNVDMISRLPGPIMDNIFRYLPLEEIVRTSVLSREWRYKWVTCPEIVLELDPYWVDEHDVEQFVSSILRQHQGPLSKFVLDTPFFQSRPDANEWILLLPADTLRKFTLLLQDGDEYMRHQLGSHLDAFQNLRKLKLESCAFDPPSEGLKNLVKLYLTCVDLVSLKFGVFLASCPALAVLTMEACSDFDCLHISGPQLRSFLFCGLFESISFGDCPLLRYVTLYLLPSDPREDHSFSFDLVRALASLPALEDLNVQASALLELVHNGAPNKLTLALKSLKKLKLIEMKFRTIAEISSALCFIRSCPNLEVLRIMSFTMQPEDGVTDFVRSLKPSVPFAKLKSVVMRYFTGHDPEMDFVKLLLASSPVLEEMEITPPWNDMAKAEEVMEKIQEFETASSMVKLSFTNY